MNQSPPDFDAIAYDPFDRPTPDWFGGTKMPLYRVVDARVFDLVRILVYQFGPPAGTLCLVAAVHPGTIEVAWGTRLLDERSRCPNLSTLWRRPTDSWFRSGGLA